MPFCEFFTRWCLAKGHVDSIRYLLGDALDDPSPRPLLGRARAALINSGFNFTLGRATINLAPADVKKEGLSSIAPAKEGPSFDLPIALRGRAEGKVGVLVPPENTAEAAAVAGLQVIPARNLRKAVGFLEGEVQIAPVTLEVARVFEQAPDNELDFAKVEGQEWVDRPPETVAASHQ